MRAALKLTDEAVAKLNLQEINTLISRAEYRATKMKLSAALKKSAMAQLVWLEAKREAQHGVPAPSRGRF